MYRIAWRIVSMGSRYPSCLAGGDARDRQCAVPGPVECLEGPMRS